MNYKELITKIIYKTVIAKGNKALADMEEHSKDAMSDNSRLLFQILKDNSNTEYGKKMDFANIHTIQEFQEKVPLTRYDDYVLYIDRMLHKGEENLITAYPIIQYAETSGSIGVQKVVPITDRF